MLVFKAGIHKMLVSIPNRKNPDQTASSKKQSDLGLPCLSRPCWQVASDQNFRKFIVHQIGWKIL